ncbi:hypothetical protein BJ165DRAFT_1406165 [Panaeolus papilionaceus]|nr:hypothetical protein BJ165DRAFT_1406165 [Panaeolus papilionaceus]
MPIEEDMKEFFIGREVKIVRRLQHKTGMIISGSFALKFLTRRAFEGNSDLDLYVGKEGAVKILRWLRSIGYVLKRSWTRCRGQVEEKMEEYLGVGASLEAVLDHERNGKKVQIMVTLGRPLDVVLQYHSTTLMEGKSLVICREGKARGHSEKALQKYEDRGWSILFEAGTDNARTFPAGWRSVHDRHAWVIPLSPAYRSNESPLEEYAWKLREALKQSGEYEHTLSIGPEDDARQE